MKFELETISQVVQGSLQPSKKAINKTTIHTDYLKEINEEFIRHYRFFIQKNTDGSFSAESFTLFSLYDPESISGLDPLLASKDQYLIEQLLDICSKKIPIPKEDIQEITLYPVNPHYYLEIALSTDIECLSPFEARFWYYEVLLSREADRLKRSFHDRIFSFKSEEKIRRHVQNHQKQLETFTEMVLEWIPKQERHHIYEFSGDFQINDVYKIIYQHLESLLTYIEKHFTKYLDMDARVPYRSKMAVSQKIKEKAVYVQKKLQQAELSRPLRDIVTEPLERLSALEKVEDFTYQKLEYFKKFLLTFYRGLSKSKAPITDEMVIDLLHDVNYNALKFFNYLTRQLNDRIEAEENIPGKLELLSSYLKHYNQRSSIINQPRFGQEGIVEQMIRWLKEEIEYYEKMLERQLQAGGNVLPSESKIKTKMSLNQVIYFLRLQVEVGMITNENKNDIFRALTEKLSTKQQENLSLGSIQNKYYEVEESTQAKVRQLLLEMLDRSKHH